MIIRFIRVEETLKHCSLSKEIGRDLLKCSDFSLGIPGEFGEV